MVVAPPQNTKYLFSQPSLKNKTSPIAAALRCLVACVPSSEILPYRRSTTMKTAAFLCSLLVAGTSAFGEFFFFPT